MSLTNPLLLNTVAAAVACCTLLPLASADIKSPPLSPLSPLSHLSHLSHLPTLLTLSTLTATPSSPTPAGVASTDLLSLNPADRHDLATSPITSPISRDIAGGLSFSFESSQTESGDRITSWFDWIISAMQADEPLADHGDWARLSASWLLMTQADASPKATLD